MQNKFAFFANFAETIRETIPAEKQAEAYQAICEYGIYGTLPDDAMLRMMCLMAKSSIYNKGGAPEGNQNAKKTTSETTQKQPKTTLNNSKTTPFETETETRNKKQETETRNKKQETEIYSADAPKKSEYAFEGKIIKLKQKDFDAWKLAYPDLNLRAELMQRDDWLAEQSPEERKKWFISTGQYFIKRNEYRKAQNAEIAEQFNNQSTAKDDDSTWSFR